MGLGGAFHGFVPEYSLASARPSAQPCLNTMEQGLKALRKRPLAHGIGWLSDQSVLMGLGMAPRVSDQRTVGRSNPSMRFPAGAWLRFWLGRPCLGTPWRKRRPKQFHQCASALRGGPERFFFNAPSPSRWRADSRWPLRGLPTPDLICRS